MINNAPGIIVTEGITGIRLAAAGSLTDSTSGALVADNSIALPKSSFVDAGCEEAPKTSLKKSEIMFKFQNAKGRSTHLNRSTTHLFEKLTLLIN